MIYKQGLSLLECKKINSKESSLKGGSTLLDSYNLTKSQVENFWT